jgi:uncharacterized protein DUF4345
MSKVQVASLIFLVIKCGRFSNGIARNYYSACNNLINCILTIGSTFMRLDRLALAVTAAAFTGFGAASFIRPGILRKVGVRAASSTGTAEIRAMYGGMELGLGAFFAYAAMQSEPSREALLAQVCGIGGLAAGRLASLCVDRPDSVMKLLFLAEGGTAALGAIALMKKPD